MGCAWLSHRQSFSCQVEELLSELDQVTVPYYLASLTHILSTYSLWNSDL